MAELNNTERAAVKNLQNELQIIIARAQTYERSVKAQANLTKLELALESNRQYVLQVVSEIAADYK